MRLAALQALATLTALLAACGGGVTAGSEATEGDATARPERIVGLSTSFPIFWSEAGNIGDLLSTDAPRHWARAELEALGELRPLDTLTSGERGTLDLPRDALLVLIQPYPFSPDELVALDDWVRAGGHVLLFADPLATLHSQFALGDRRRPQDMAMLSPILARWGLAMTFDQEQDAGPQTGDAFGVTLPTNLRGELKRGSGSSTCDLSNGGLAARCTIGEGSVLVVADSALFDEAHAEDSDEANTDEASRRAALRALSGAALAGS